MFKKDIAALFSGLHQEIVTGLEALEGQSNFIRDGWTRSEGGGGLTCVLENGSIFEKAGVAYSCIEGTTPSFLPNEIQKDFKDYKNETNQFMATGVSLVIHPFNPFIPIIHMNIRFFEAGNVYWFGGGIDLTPIYYDEHETNYFHETLNKVCNVFSPTLYPQFKENADEYFFIKHRNETRGIGGIFFDKLNASKDQFSFSELDFTMAVGKLFLPLYTTLVKNKQHMPFNDDHKKWQLMRRGRYVEFNLLYDRGTKFGLETGGRVESILMSLPAHASWKYNYQVGKNTEEELLLQNLVKGKSRISENKF